ncbi:hypothetical protein GALMADRAFT_570069 [Galerina marginata CBS 339.88]|uniref:UvrD-like helicase C-terminal domain-containing protein n=1 Tax=Galerina marginata (strain CBS 339.88) TaxID=685588 RepID=A0A067T4Z4_GALM3|nr:hypothetical protein GALMADRAFT_570069 [Galerina marginata CBS 339.88]
MYLPMPARLIFDINPDIFSYRAWAVTIHKSQGLTLERIKLGLGKREFSTGLMFVGLSRVETIDGIMSVDQVDYSRVRALGGKHMQYRFDEYARRYQ